MITVSASWNKCWTSGIPIYMHMQLSYIDAHSGGFRAARLPQAGDTGSRATMSQLSAWSNKHNWPEFYPGNARACPGLEPPMDAHSIRELLQQCMFILTADTSFGWGKEPHFFASSISSSSLWTRWVLHWRLQYQDDSFQKLSAKMLEICNIVLKCFNFLKSTLWINICSRWFQMSLE